MNRTRGFTLLELMLVMGIVMILAVVGIGTYMQATVKSRDSQRKGNINQLSRAVEAFYADIGRYPHANASNEMYCIVKTGSTITDTDCGNKLTAFIDGVNTVYINLSSDPIPTQTYVYSSVDGQGYSFYAGLENTNDKDLIKDTNGNVIVDPWGISCGTGSSTVPCNYKVTETGQVKSL